MPSSDVSLSRPGFRKLRVAVIALKSFDLVMYCCDMSTSVAALIEALLTEPAWKAFQIAVNRINMALNQWSAGK